SAIKSNGALLSAANFNWRIPSAAESALCKAMPQLRQCAAKIWLGNLVLSTNNNLLPASNSVSSSRCDAVASISADENCAVNQNVEPSPLMLVTPISPPIHCARLLQLARPKPVPP